MTKYNGFLSFRVIFYPNLDKTMNCSSLMGFGKKSDVAKQKELFLFLLEGRRGAEGDEQLKEKLWRGAGELTVTSFLSFRFRYRILSCDDRSAFRCKTNFIIKSSHIILIFLYF